MADVDASSPGFGLTITDVRDAAGTLLAKSWTESTRRRLLKGLTVVSYRAPGSDGE